MAPVTAKLAELGDLNGARFAKIIGPKIDHFFDAAWDRLVLEFGGFGEPTWNQVGTKIYQKIHVKMRFIFDVIFWSIVYGC